MSPSDGAAAPQPPTEVLAIAVALAVLWPADAAEIDGPGPAVAGAPDGPWRWAGRRWERRTGHRWS